MLKTLRIGWPALVLAAGLLVAQAGQAWAHKIKLFATVEGQVISGYGYFPGGGRAKNTRLDILGPDGQKLDQIQTDEKGEFSYEAKTRVDHQLVLDTGDGHLAKFLITADELPQSLPGPGPAVQAAAPAAQEAAKPAPQAAQPAAPALDQEELAALVEAAVSRQVRPLREQIETWEEKIRWHDVMGGLGYLFGVFGLAFFLLGRRRQGAARG